MLGAVTCSAHPFLMKAAVFIFSFALVAGIGVALLAVFTATDVAVEVSPIAGSDVLVEVEHLDGPNEGVTETVAASHPRLDHVTGTATLVGGHILWRGEDHEMVYLAALVLAITAAVLVPDADGRHIAYPVVPVR